MKVQVGIKGESCKPESRMALLGFWACVFAQNVHCYWDRGELTVVLVHPSSA